MNRADNLFRRATDRPDGVALVFGERSLSFAEWWSEASRAARGFADAGLTPGSRVAFLLSSRPEFPILQYGCFAAGGVVMPLNTSYRPEEVGHALNECEAEYVVTEAALLERVEPVLQGRCPSVRRIFVVDGCGREHGGPLRPASVLTGTGNGTGRALPAPVDLPGGAVGLILYTSATTGRAKGVMLTLANLAANYDSTPEWLGYTGADTILCALPLFNTFALNQCVNSVTVTGGRTVVLPRFDAVECMRAVERHGCTVFPCVPTMLQKVLSHPDVGRHALGSLTRISVGAAPVPTPLLLRAQSFFGAGLGVVTGYGLTEATALVTVMPVELDPAGRQVREKSVGRALPGTEVRILGPDGAALPAGHTGEVAVRGPGVMAGYYRRAEDTAAAMAGGWLHTGDLGVMDTDGFLWVVDRLKDVIIRGGQNIYPVDIEDALYSHPAVAEAAVVGMEDESYGEVPMAYIAFKPGQSADTAELMALCTDKLARFKLPAAITILPELPKGPTGKILRRGLRAVAGAKP